MKTIICLLTAGVTALAAPAHAEPVSNEVLEYTALAEDAVCITLSQYPTVSGASGIMAAITEDGFTPYEAGQIVALAVFDACPEFIPVLQRFVAVYGA